MDLVGNHLKAKVAMLTEDDVVTAVARYLEANGWRVNQQLTTFDRGVDLAAERAGQRLHVEAKGATSSKQGTRRFGAPFTRAQVFDHVAKAVHTALAVVSRADGTLAALAVPDDAHHRDFVGRVLPVLARVGVRTFFVSGSGAVRAREAEAASGQR